MKRLTALIVALLTLAPAAALAQARPAYKELRPSLQVETEGKIEVLEFFWYGCIHCYNLQPALEPWVKKLPADVKFRRVPVVFNARWGHDATIYYTFEVMGVLEKVHRAFFDAIHRDRLRTDNSAALDEWLQKQGIDPKKFTDTMKSFGVQSKTKRATMMTAAYKIEGTPTLAVHGRYTVSADLGRDGMLSVTSSLIEQVRKTGK